MKAAALPCLIAATVTLAAPAWAHDVPYTYLNVHIERGQVDATLVAHHVDVAHDLGIEPPELLLDRAAVTAHGRAIVALLQSRLVFVADGRTLTGEWAMPEVVTHRQSLELRGRFQMAGVPGTLAVTARMFPYDPAHQTFVNLYEQSGLTAQAILTPDRPSFEHFSGTPQGVLAVVKRFVQAGVHHILVGPDHLLFLTGLLLLGSSIGQLAAVVTAFTVAHSVTLSLAVLNVLNPPAQIVEPAIALSIVYVGADNLLARGARDLRALIALVFGFIHGFGFAGVLRELELPTRSLGWTLFSFNLGVELGQLAFVIPVAITIGLVRARSVWAGRRLAVAGSVVIIAAGTFWFFERVFHVAAVSR